MRKRNNQIGKNGLLGLGLAVAATAAAASPAEAQYYPDGRPGSRVANEIARGAEAIGNITDALRGAIDNVRYRNPAERYAAQTCAIRAERYGRVRIDRVYPYKRRSFRVEGVVDGAGYRYDRSYGPRSFTCTVRDDGYVSKFKTRRLRYRY